MGYSFSKEKFITSFNAKSTEEKSADSMRLTHKPDGAFKLFPYKASGKTQAPIVMNLEDIVSAFFREIQGKRTEPVDFDSLSEAILEEVEIDDEDIDYFKDMLQSLFFVGNDFIANNLGLYPYQTVSNNKSAENLAHFLYSVLGLSEEDHESVETAKGQYHFNVLEDMVMQTMENKKVSESEEKEPYFSIKADIQKKFKDDFNFMLNTGLTSLENFSNLFSVYYFYYVSQTCITLDRFCDGKRSETVEFYYALDWEKVSKNRMCCVSGWDKLQASVAHMFSHAITLEIKKINTIAFERIKAAYSKFSSQSEEISKFISFMQEKTEIDSAENTYSLSDMNLFQVETLNANGIDQSVEKAKKLIAKRDLHQEKIGEIDNSLSVDIDDASLEKIFALIKEKEREIIEKQVTIDNLKKERTSVHGNFISAESEFSKFAEKTLAMLETVDDDKRTIKYANMAIEIIKLYRVKLQERKTDVLAQTMTECYKRLANKKNLVKKIKMDADTLDLHYIDGYGEEIVKKRLSAGEKQLMVISLLWALAICSKKKLPVIIDTPLSRLDSAHREALINADSRTHDYGESARKIVEDARAQVANLLGVGTGEVFFTSGSTESNNIAIQGLIDYAIANNKKHVITSTIEHKAVLETVKSLESMNSSVLSGLRNQPSMGRSTELTDSRISLFSAQRGKCALSGELFENAADIVCWLKTPAELGGKERYRNMILFHNRFLPLLQECPKNELKEIADTLKATKELMLKVNSLRQQAGLSAIEN